MIKGIILASLLLLSGQYNPAGPVFPVSAGSGCGAYLHYRVITVPAQSTLSGNLTNYPVLVSNTYSYLATAVNGGLVQNSSGFDVGFFTDNTCTTKLPWETETYTATSGLVNYWVQVPTISKTAGITFVMAYDNPAITTDQSNPTGVWDANFKGVYHLPNGTTLTNLDSTSNANNGTPVNASAGAGQIDGAASFVGTGSINVGTNLNPVGTGRTYEAWVNATSLNTFSSVIAMSESGGQASTILVKSNGKMAMFVSATTQVNYNGTGTHTLTTNTWFFVAWTYDSTAGLIGYVNGEVDGTAAANGALFNGAGQATFIGNSTVSGRNWNGKIDEVRTSMSARSADWIKTDYNSQSSPATFYSVSGQF